MKAGGFVGTETKSACGDATGSGGRKRYSLLINRSEVILQLQTTLATVQTSDVAVQLCAHRVCLLRGLFGLCAFPASCSIRLA